MTTPVEVHMDERDRRRGMRLSLAVGDALGATVEFEPPGSFAPVTGYRGGGPHGLTPGEWTDDTCMALALADSITETGWDLNDQADRYLAWWRGGEFSVNVRVLDDADTTGAVCGQLAGADWGESGIPADLRIGLAGRALIERALNGLTG